MAGPMATGVSGSQITKSASASSRISPLMPSNPMECAGDEQSQSARSATPKPRARASVHIVGSMVWMVGVPARARRKSRSAHIFSRGATGR
eukprot:CAMPEP_0205920676 /NCGR_PEP_ID=MMETSP1325-20131115/11575_1 /ASSEMBLY_ACC=CAM_ASM_000708 /TAXON_ID=236786 /ORGANISM="Florenciella sp., Strain RCC1007" /LENGTH=90 /DNA_ID=CAMNT_0053288387 /DNA_START=274 /DNA_END=546 /DNA_ORIENTATION=-